ncbi:hypothetical protein I6F26_28185 [Ensifer sp. IC3342]|nr:hypothetical protein [Ensifer sp. BRP08]MCA1450431.1 hypothetical protein [Ensifer sp. IC3342]
MLMSTEGRSENYVRQLAGYSVFIPKDLPPDPALQFDAEMQNLLSRADRALGRLDGSIQTLPNPDLFVMMYVRKEAVLSSQIEGTQASINDLLKAEADIYDQDSSIPPRYLQSEGTCFRAVWRTCAACSSAPALTEITGTSGGQS